MNRLRLLTILCTPLGAAACGPPTGGEGEAAGPRSVLLVTLDTARRDAFGFMGASPSPSPNLDALAGGALVFEDAYTTAPLTLPAHASLLTGLYPATHGLRDNGAGRLPGAAATLAETLSGAGWRARAAVSAFVLDACFGLDRGFESYQAPPRRPSAIEINVVQLRADAMLERALADMEVLLSGEEPFFYWLHLYDPHAPYDAPGTSDAATRAGMDLRELYDAEIRHADQQLGRLFELLERRGRWEELVVVFTSDHGEGLEDGHERTHGFFVFDETMRIPLVFKHPDLMPGRFAGPVSLVDVAPTVLASLGLALEGGRFDGIDLGPYLRGEETLDGERLLLMESYQPYVGHGWAPFQAGVQGERKYVRSRRRELFDRSVDPREDSNLWRADDAAARRLAEAADARFRELGGRLEAGELTLGAAEQRALADLGYVGAGEGLDAGVELDFESLPDPHAKYPLYERMLAVSQQIAAGEIDAALGELRSLSGLEPENPALLERLGELLLYQGDSSLAEAEVCYTRVLELRPGRIQSVLGLANVELLRAARLRERMQEELEAGREAEARSIADQWRPLARRAADGLRSVLEREANHPTALHNLSSLFVSLSEDASMRKQGAEARRLLQEARRLVLRLMAELEETDPDRLRYESQRRMLEERLRRMP